MFTGHDVTVLRYGTDRYGDRTVAGEHTVSRCAFAPRATSSGRGAVELSDRTGTVVADAELYAPFDADITPQDVVRLPDATEWEVVGARELWRSPYSGSWSPGAVFPLRRVTG